MSVRRRHVFGVLIASDTLKSRSCYDIGVIRLVVILPRSEMVNRAKLGTLSWVRNGSTGMSFVLQKPTPRLWIRFQQILELESSTPAVIAACECLSWMATCRLKCRFSILQLERLICWVVALVSDSYVSDARSHLAVTTKPVEIHRFKPIGCGLSKKGPFEWLIAAPWYCTPGSDEAKFILIILCLQQRKPS